MILFKRPPSLLAFYETREQDRRITGSSGQYPRSQRSPRLTAITAKQTQPGKATPPPYAEMAAW